MAEGSQADEAEEIDDAAPLEAVKWSFVRRRLGALFLAHGYREVSPPPLELRGTHMMARRDAAWPVGDDLELRADPVLSLAQLYARARRAADGAQPPMARWVLSDVVFDPTASGPHRYQAWPAVAGALFGVDAPGPELEALLLAQRVGVDLGLSLPQLRVSFGGASTSAFAVRNTLRELEVPFVEQRGDGEGLALELVAQPAEGPPMVVLRGRRQDALLTNLGERPAPLFGLVASVRRASSCVPGGAETYEPAAEVFFVVADGQARVRALQAAMRERARGLRVELELRDLPREAQLARAAAVRARAVVEFDRTHEHVRLRLAGEDDAREVPLAELSSALRRLLR